jgi:hypothetical protein
MNVKIKPWHGQPAHGGGDLRSLVPGKEGGAT